MVATQETSDSSQILAELTNRLRVLESKQNLFSEKLLMVNQNMIEEYKKLNNDIKAMRAETSDIRKDMQNVKTIVKHLSEEAANFARKDTIKVLEKYINLWNPLRFVTREEVERLVNRKEGVKVAERSTDK